MPCGQRRRFSAGGPPVLRAMPLAGALLTGALLAVASAGPARAVTDGGPAVPPQQSVSVPPQQSVSVPPQQSVSVPPQQSVSVPPSIGPVAVGICLGISVAGVSVAAQVFLGGTACQWPACSCPPAPLPPPVTSSPPAAQPSPVTSLPSAPPQTSSPLSVPKPPGPPPGAASQPGVPGTPGSPPPAAGIPAGQSGTPAVVASTPPPGHHPRPVPGALRPLSWAGLHKAAQRRVPVTLLATFVLIILTLCIAAAATRFSRRLR